LEIQRHWLESPIRRETNVYDAAVLLGNMGKLYLEQPDYDLAYFVYEEALLLQTTVFRKDHDIVLASLTSLALAKAQNKQLQKALQILTGCLRSQNVRFGPNSVASIDTTGLMGYLYAREENYDEALKCLSKVKKWQSARLPVSHPALEATSKAIKKLEESIEWV
jgi:tetratricopeptide (TPR) repeat protein